MPNRLSKPQWERFLKGRHVAVLGTIRASGEPLLTPIWYLYRDGAILMRTADESEKAKNIRNDPRVTVCVQDERPPYKSVTVYGAATIEAVDDALGPKMARHYLGAIAGAAYMQVAADEVQRGVEITLAVKPVRVLTQDYSAETPVYGRAWLVIKRLLPPWL
ncbi:MAG: PPOX class F420-dependent oxidoreductase [Dehalococcoidia bacterium]